MLACVLTAGQGTWCERSTGAMQLIMLMLCLQFDVVLAAYKKKSRLWNPTLNKFAEGRLTVKLPLTC
jgi:hypothetical protein